MSEHNQYQAPQSRVDAGATTQYGEVKIFGVSGRLGRVRYLAYLVGIPFLVIMLASLVSFLTGMAGGEAGAAIGAIIVLVAYVFVLVFSIMVAIQRCHDFNASGWLSILTLVPLVSLIFMIIPGTDGENRFGHQPPPNTWGAIVLALILPLIAILGILAAIAIPAYQGYMDRAKESSQQQYEQQR